MSILRHDLAELLADEEVPHGAANAITDEFIRRLQQRFGGDRLLVPKVDRGRRDAAILADWKAGVTIDEIATRHGVHRRTVYNVIRRRKVRKPAAGGNSGSGFGKDGWGL